MIYIQTLQYQLADTPVPFINVPIWYCNALTTLDKYFVIGKVFFCKIFLRYLLPLFGCHERDKWKIEH